MCYPCAFLTVEHSHVMPGRRAYIRFIIFEADITAYTLSQGFDKASMRAGVLFQVYCLNLELFIV